MNNLTFVAKTAEILKVEDVTETRFVKNEFGTDRQVLGTKTCCVCEERIWKTDNHSRMTINTEAFKVADYRAYLLGTPDYITNSNALLECHFTCKDELAKQLHNGTFVQR
jgi:hypothetical protein